MLEFPHFLESMSISIGPRKVADLCFLNYKPKSKNLKHQPLNFGEEIKQIEEHFSDIARKASNEIFNNETELMNIIPKKSNIDLKRNLSKKLEKLAKKTDLAILEMIKDKLRKEQPSSTDLKFDEKKDAKTEIKKEPQLKMFNSSIVYDEEFYNKFEDFEEEGNEGSELTSGMQFQEHLYNQEVESDED